MKTKPIRIQRSRRTIQKSPNILPVVYVGRPSKWGNPFKLVNDKIYIKNQPPAAPAAKFIEPKYLYLCSGSMETVLLLYKTVVTGFMQPGQYNMPTANMKLTLPWVDHFYKLKITDISNKNLSCWCKPGSPCHADILLDLANTK